MNVLRKFEALVTVTVILVSDESEEAALDRAQELLRNPSVDLRDVEKPAHVSNWRLGKVWRVP
jgi:hypothetical protein